MAVDAIGEQATLAFQMAMEDPERAKVMAAEALSRAVDSRTPEAETTALRALGLADQALGNIPAAVAHLEAAVKSAERTDDPKLIADARISLAWTLTFAGDSERALATLDGAAAVGTTVVILGAQKAGILTSLGRYEEALEAYQPVIPALRRLGDPFQMGRALNNRGLLHVYTGRFKLAESDLTKAERLLADAGSPTEAAGFRHNRGFALARKGELPAALALFEEADQSCRAVGVQSAARGLDRAGVLLGAGLLTEARHAADIALQQLRQGGNRRDLAEGLVLLADIALLAGDARASNDAADEAAQLFDEQHRAGWLALAQAAVARAGLSLGDHDAALAALASDAAAHLDDMGQIDRATMAHAVAGQLWLAIGALQRGLDELDLAGTRRNRGTAGGRLAAWEAQAFARLARGDRRGAMRALRCALTVVADQQAVIGATGLRAHITIHANQAASLGLRLALETGRAGTVIQWMEHHRAHSLRAPAARPPRDHVLAGQLAELRGLASVIAACAGSGTDPRPLQSRQNDLERQIRERAWQAAGSHGSAAQERALNVADLHGELAGRSGAALVELAEIDGVVHAVVVAGGRCHLRRLATASEIHEELAHVRMGMRRLAYALASPRLAAGAREQLATAATRLDGLVLAPISSLIGSRPIVVVPTGELHAMPWGVLPTLAGRSVSVAPSARLWLNTAVSARGVKASDGVSVVLVAGPGLEGAEREVTTLSVLYPSAQVLIGRQASVRAVTAALEGADVAHVAAHASFRADNGLWSSVELADGSLTVYELEQLRRPPRVVVLSACQSGLSTVRPGDEVMGLVASLLALGTEAVVASVVPVEDWAGESLMFEFHRCLQSGATPAVALARVQSASMDSVGLSYVCFGGA